MSDNEKKNLSWVVLGSFLIHGCATGPTQPTAEIRSIDRYPAFECSDIRGELLTVGSWEQYQSSMQTYQKDQADSMKMWDGIGAVMGALASQYDPSSASTFQAMSQSNAVSTAHVETAAQEAAEHQAGMAKRRAVLERMLVLKGC
ncbi:MAG: hypothetical protein V4688_00530 [Pseudomonadota bacterium]